MEGGEEEQTMRQRRHISTHHRHQKSVTLLPLLLNMAHVIEWVFFRIKRDASGIHRAAAIYGRTVH